MSPEEFVKNFYLEKQNITHSCFENQSEHKSVTSIKIKELELNEIQTEKLKEIVSGLLTDTFYTILLGLDGCANIGSIQESFKIYDEENNLISEGGDLEGYAYDYFHGD